MSSPNIAFGTDGWRAIIGEDFSSENVKLCAQAVADYLSNRNLHSKGIIVGYDTRLGSKTFSHDVARVLAANNIPVFLSTNFAPLRNSLWQPWLYSGSVVRIDFT